MKAFGGGISKGRSAAYGYYWALLGIFFYHSLQVFVLSPSYDGCGVGFSGPSPFNLIRGSASEPGVRKALSEFVTPDHAQRKRPDHNCSRWNTTYVLPRAPSFISTYQRTVNG